MQTEKYLRFKSSGGRGGGGLWSGQSLKNQEQSNECQFCQMLIESQKYNYIKFQSIFISSICMRNF